MAQEHRFSLFAQPVDRAAFVAYFLGAVVPLGALVFVTQRYLDAVGLEASVQSRLFLVGLIVSIGVLSLASFLALRRSTRQALTRVDEDRKRLAELVRCSRTLAAAAHRSDVLRIAVEHAAIVTGARAAYFVAGQGEDGISLLAHVAGLQAEEVYAAHRVELDKVVGEVIATRHAVDTAVVPAGNVPHQHRISGVIAVPCGKEMALVTVFGPASTGSAANVHALSTLAGLASAALNNVELQADQRNFFTHVTHMLINALDSHIGYHTDHSKNVARLSLRLGRELGLEDDRLERLHFAALLHDVGLLEIDPGLVSNQRAMRKHPDIGAEMLERIALWEDLAPWVRHHHEWFDGNGYPAGLAAEDIPLESRILGLSEAFESMTSSAGYKPAVDEQTALERIEAGAGTQFDPELARVFVGLADEGPLLGD